MNYFKQKVLTIAGSDCSGGAGIQADLKTYTALGCYGMSVITAITAQNTTGVFDVMAVPLSTIESQLHAIFSDISNVNIIKIGMIYDKDIINLVSDILNQNEFFDKKSNKKIVLDPVMIAKSGSSLFKDDALNSLKTQLIPMSFLVTPNFDEAIAISEYSISSNEKIDENIIFQMGKKILSLGCENVLMKGGHIFFNEGDCVDYLINNNMNSPSDMISFRSKRIDTQNTHGTGCTLSSAIASFLAAGYDVSHAIEKGKEFVTNGMINAQYESIGQGHGPLNHCFGLK